MEEVDEQFMAETIKAMSAIAILMALFAAVALLWGVL